jgi:hypothetical protein
MPIKHDDRAGAEVERLSAFIMDSFAYWTVLHLLHRVIRHQRPVPDFPHTAADRALLDMVADRTNFYGLTLTAKFDNPLVMIGAPAACFAPQVAEKLGGRSLRVKRLGSLNAPIGNGCVEYFLVPKEADIVNAAKELCEK